ncbi:hypothetical protein EBU71_22255, partial [bacterium]|nr:hypothetical protein [Candidatus Elulimicrobium humile]
ALGIMEERISGPQIKLLIDELLQLRIMRDKVDHPRKGSKDLADAVCGSIYNAISRSAKGDRVVEIHTWAETKDDNTRTFVTKDGVPKRMPQELYEAISEMRIV